MLYAPLQLVLELRNKENGLTYKQVSETKRCK